MKAKVEQREQNSLADSNLCDMIIATSQRDISMKGKMTRIVALACIAFAHHEGRPCIHQCRQ